MAYQVLARKWRPKKFAEVVGQEHVTRTLQNAIKHNKLAHAYLFTGTRGVGKTSIARLFAKAIRCIERSQDFNPCLKCSACLDVDSGSSMDYIEIDGASNNSVEDVRSLIENVQYLPSTGKYKIYVIDEVHMLSLSAFNALLKTLEEPPAHTLFILATTDPQKLLGTVISRCQRYDFKNVSVAALTNHVKKIADSEGITFENAQIPTTLAELGRGSVRDTLSIFDQVLGLSGSNNITEDSLTLALGLAGAVAIKNLLSAILVGETKQVSHVYDDLIRENIDLKKLCDQILDGLYRIINLIDDQERLYEQKLVERGSLNEITISELFWIYETLAKDFTWALSSINPERVILIVLQKITLRRTILSGDDLKLTNVPQEQSRELQQVEEKEMKPVKSWSAFLAYLLQVSPATAANLEQGNLLEEINTEVTPLTIQIAFPESGLVFKEYIEQKDIYPRLKSHMADFFEREVDQINLKTSLLTAGEKRDKNFQTIVEIEEDAIRKDEEKKRQKILENPFVKEAEKIFNSKIDKIVIKNEETR